MRKEEFERTDGTKGTNLRLEAEVGKTGDEFKPSFNTPRMDDSHGFENYSIGFLQENSKEVGYIKLTKTQYEQLVEMGDLAGKTIQAYGYKNSYGNQVGVREKKE